MILLVDNYDSFVHNLARYLMRLGQETVVVRNDRIDPVDLNGLDPSAIVLSPGPRTPFEAGHSIELVRLWASRIPILGVCLGHQTIAVAFGGRVVRAAEPVHGRTSLIHHDGSHLFRDIPSPMVASRYHSLIVSAQELPSCLQITARLTDQTVMGLRHETFPVFGIQFHPESILTEQGYDVLANFLRCAGIDPRDSLAGNSLPGINDERSIIADPQRPPPSGPVTF